MGVRGEVAHGIDARKRLSSAPFTRALRAAAAASAAAATAPSSPSAAMAAAMAVQDELNLVVRPRTFPFPPPRAPLALPLAAKNTPRKALLKRWRGARGRAISREDAVQALRDMRARERELREDELVEIVALASARADIGDTDLRRLHSAVQNVQLSARQDLVRVATRHTDVVVGAGDQVTLALHEMGPQARAEVQVVLDRERGRQTIAASEKLQVVRGRIEQLEKCSVKVVGVEKMSPI